MNKPNGAIDYTFGEAELEGGETLAEVAAKYERELSAGDIAIDLVTRQPLYVAGVVAESVAEYYEREGFDLLNYKVHPYLPVQLSDPVIECVFIPRSVEQVNSIDKSYDFPAGRLARVPIERALDGSGSDE